MTHNIITLVLKCIYIIKIILLVAILPVEILSGIITIDNLDFLQEVPRDTKAHLFLPLPFYMLSIYYVWNHDYNSFASNSNSNSNSKQTKSNAINNIDKHLQWFSNTFLFESCLTFILSLYALLYY